MKTKNNRTLVISLLTVAIVLSFAVAVILPAVTVAAEVRRVTQIADVQEDVQDSIESMPVIYDDSEVETQMSGELAKEFEDRCRIMHSLFGVESVEEQTAIMATLINREESIEYADNFYDVVITFEPFMHVSVNGLYFEVEMEEIQTQTIEAVMDALSNGADPTERLLKEEAEKLGMDYTEYAEGGALFFRNLADCDEEALEAIKVEVQIGDYIFYKK